MDLNSEDRKARSSVGSSLEELMTENILRLKITYELPFNNWFVQLLNALTILGIPRKHN